MLLTEQEIIELCADNGLEFCPNWGTAFTGNTEIIRVVHAVEAKMIEKIKAQGAVAWLHRDRPESDVVTTAVKHVWGNVAVGRLVAYDIPLYRLPEGD